MKELSYTVISHSFTEKDEIKKEKYEYINVSSLDADCIERRKFKKVTSFGELQINIIRWKCRDCLCNMFLVVVEAYLG